MAIVQSMWYPQAGAFDSSGNIYVADGTHYVEKFGVVNSVRIGSARALPNNSVVSASSAVVTATNVESGSVFVESSDRSSGIKLVTSQSLSVGNQVSFSGVLNRVDGEYQVGSVSFQSIGGGTALAPLAVSSYGIGDDLTETLSYAGVNTTGLLVRMTGAVTGVVSGQRVVYVDDGGRLQDGVASLSGIRVHIPAGITLPDAGHNVIVTGISRPEKITLTSPAVVNYTNSYPTGTVVYVPSIWVRDSNDLQVIN